MVRECDNTRGLAILQSILADGLACTSEALRSWTDPLRVERLGEKRELRFIARQTRSCFTLCTTEELARPHASVRFRDANGRVAVRPASHLDLFGSFGIALDPLRARRIGVMPTMYFYTVSGTQSGGPEDILHRLAEARQALTALHLVEERSRRVEIPWIDAPTPEGRASSEELGFFIDKAVIRERIDRISRREASFIFDIFDLDRRTSWQIVDKIDFILGLFQNTDSFLEDSPLSFYEQREWRLPYISQPNLGWYSLGEHPRCRDPDRPHNDCGAHRVRTILESAKGRPLTSDEACATWVLFEVDNAPFATLIDEIVCPPAYKEEVENIVQEAKKSGKAPQKIKITPIESRYT